VPSRNSQAEPDARKPNIHDKARNYSLGIKKPKIKVVAAINIKKVEGKNSTPEKDL
jgi:hypothetical protein